MGAISESIRVKLEAAFQPSVLVVDDDSNRHAGHSGARAGGESHFNVTIEAQAFSGIARVARQRMVYHALAEELAGPVHALSVKARAPGED
ncbi:BolA family protein [Phenylobacterium sp.]|jgi:BolA protein|uniref:BolA family protein n=1 Tax=Phenylobacterium sp. TaxID=1871053 RepID=UPI0037CB6E42